MFYRVMINASIGETELSFLNKTRAWENIGFASRKDKEIIMKIINKVKKEKSKSDGLFQDKGELK